jgi:ankyrin repeat protein
VVEHLMVNNPEHVNAIGGYYVAPLIAALNGGHSQTAKLLRDNGAHPNVTGYVGRTPLHGAAWQGDLEMVKVLLYKADVNARSDFGETPLHFAYQGWSAPPNVIPSLPKVARLFLEHGAEVNALTGSRSTALHFAARDGMVEVVRVFLEHGADVGAENDDGKTAFQLAQGEEGNEIKKLLPENGAR